MKHSTIKLSLKERIELGADLPQKGAFEELIYRADILEKVKITQEDIEKFDIRQTEQGYIQWSISKAEGNELEVDLTIGEYEYLRNWLLRASEKKELTLEWVNLYKQLNKKEIGGRNPE